MIQSPGNEESFQQITASSAAPQGPFEQAPPLSVEPAKPFEPLLPQALGEQQSHR